MSAFLVDKKTIDKILTELIDQSELQAHGLKKR